MSDAIALSKVFRVFISSTFSDFVEERNYLQQVVFPHLEEVCRRHGALFQPVDLRWGITDEAAMGQRTLEICLNEVRQCSEITPRPGFLILLGDRYGWIPIPVRVEQEKFESCCPSQLMRDWYRLDSNSGYYCLRSRTGDYTDSGRWQAVEDQLRQDWAQRGEAQISATHAEIENGLNVPWKNRESIFCFKRTLREIPLTQEGAPFADLLREQGTYRADQVSRQKLDALEKYISGLLPRKNLITFASGFRDRESLVRPFCEEIERRLEETILRELKHIETIDRQDAALTSERAFSALVGEHYVGQERLLENVLGHIRSGSGMAVVWGKEGKSAFSAALAGSIRGRRALLRHVGVSLLSGSVESLAESILTQLHQETGRTPSPGKKEFPEVLQGIREQLEDGQTVLILDSADRLPNAGLLLKPLADLPNVVATASTRRLGDALRAGYIGELLPLSIRERRQLFEELLAAQGRHLSVTQREQMEDVLSGCESAESVRLAAAYAAGLHSWEKPFAANHEKEIAALISDSLIHEQMHAPLLTKRMMTYLAMGRNGVTLPDLIAMLSRDREVFAEFNQGLYHPLCREEIPVSVLSRLYYDLAPYLRHIPVMGADTVSFAFDVFRSLALDGGMDRQALANAVSYYEEQADHRNPAALSELPYLLLHYRGTNEALAWFCRGGHLCGIFRKGLETEVLTDASQMEDIPEAAAFRRILLNRFPDFRRRPEAIEAVLQSETAVLHPGDGAEVLRSLLDPVPFTMHSWSGRHGVTPEIALTGLLSYAFCIFSPDGSRLLASMTNGVMTLYDLRTGSFSQSIMPGAYMDRFLYACPEGGDAILALEEHRLMRLDAPDFWHTGLDQSVWSETETPDVDTYLALSSELPLTYGIKNREGVIELIQRTADGEERIPMDFLLRTSEINHIAVTENGDIAVAFLNGAIAATTGLYDETTSGHALMCCTFLDRDRKIAAASSDGRLFIFDAEGGFIEKLDLSIPDVMEQQIECMVYDRKREILFLGHRCGYLSVVSVSGGFRLLGQVHSGMRMGILCCALSPDGSLLALGGRGNMQEAPLSVFRTEDILKVAGKPSGKGDTAQDFDKNISAAQAAGNRWYYIHEHLGQEDRPRELYSAPEGDPSSAERIAEASCYAVCARRSLLFHAAPGKENHHTFHVIAGGVDYPCGTMDEFITGMAVSGDETMLAVATERHVFFYDLTTFEIRKKLFRAPVPWMKQTGSAELYSERSRFDAPMRFDGGKLLVCCEKLFSFYDEDRGRPEAGEIRQLYVIDPVSGETGEAVNYQGFAHDVYLEGGGIVLACGEGRLWRCGRYAGGEASYFRSSSGAGVWRYPRGGLPAEPDQLFDLSVSCILKTPDSLYLASDEGDIACIRENRETAWFSIPAKPAAMMREGSRLMVLDDGAKNGGIPRVYRFSL